MLYSYQTWVEVSSRKVTIISDVSPRAAEQLIRLNEHGNGDILNCCERMLESRVKKIRMSLFLAPSRGRRITITSERK